MVKNATQNLRQMKTQTELEKAVATPKMMRPNDMPMMVFLRPNLESRLC